MEMISNWFGIWELERENRTGRVGKRNAHEMQGYNRYNLPGMKARRWSSFKDHTPSNVDGSGTYGLLMGFSSKRIIFFVII